MMVACPGPTSSSEEVVLVESVDFNFHQGENVLYFSVQVNPDAITGAVDSVSIDWYGTDTSEASDRFLLNDSGKTGDILALDNIWSRKVSNTQPTVSTPISPTDTLPARLLYTVHYGHQSTSDGMTFSIANRGPEILSVTMPDTMHHPDSSGYYAVSNLVVEVTDPDGLDDIQTCYLMFMKPDSTFANDGNPITLYDDGRIVDQQFLWDEVANDGKYSRHITIGFENPLGTYHVYYYARDYSGILSEPVERVLEVVE